MQTQNKNLTGLEYRSVAECWPCMHEALSMMPGTAPPPKGKDHLLNEHIINEGKWSQIHLLKAQYVTTFFQAMVKRQYLFRRMS